MDIFISYARADRERVKFIAGHLISSGYSVWWDRDIRPGEEFDEVIDKAILRSKAIVVVWSENSIKSRWVKEEAEDGLAADILVPVTIDCVTIPRGFRRIQAAPLEDSPQDPTQSEHWPEFLSTLQELAGPPSKEHSPRPVGSNNESHTTASKTTSAQTPAWKRYWPIAVGVTALLAFAAFAIQFISPDSLRPDTRDQTPMVLGIYPSDSFGVNMRDGLRESLADYPAIVVRDLEVPLDDMKNRNAPGLIEELEKYLANNNVIAIVGPAITEFTPEVLRTVEQSGHEPAIILTTAGSRKDLGWDDSSLPIFRVGSGVDERAAQFAELATTSIENGLDLVFMVESVPGQAELTYGELFFRRVTERLPEWSQWYREGRVRSIDFRRGEIMQSLSQPRQKRIFDEDKIIILLGLAGDYRALVENFYTTDAPSRRALLGGAVISFSLSAIDNQELIQHDRVFDMTDVFQSSPESANLPDGRRFREIFGVLSPRWRLEAVAYDSGLVIKQAIGNMGADAITAEKLVDQLRSESFDGVTGEITFTPSGQNSGPAGGLQGFYNVQYDPAMAGWQQVENLQDLMAASTAE